MRQTRKKQAKVNTTKVANRNTIVFLTAVLCVLSEAMAFSGDGKKMFEKHESFRDWNFKPAFSSNRSLLRERRRAARNSSSPKYSKRPALPLISCVSKTHCNGNSTVFYNDEHFTCYCDNACFETFHDCCPDYESACGKQITTDHEGKEKTTFSSWWECVEMDFLLKFIVHPGLRLKGPTGVWMIQRCPSTWPSDETKEKCHNAPETFSHPIENYLPVVAENLFTYRNKHCAICHSVKEYSTWNVRLKANKRPPRLHNLDAVLCFIMDKAEGSLRYVAPAKSQPRRYCAGKNYKSGCDDVSHQSFKDCLNGPVQVVTNTSFYFKNNACASCNGHPELNGWMVGREGRPGGDGTSPHGSIPFTIVYNIVKREDVKLTRKIKKEYSGPPGPPGPPGPLRLPDHSGHPAGDNTKNPVFVTPVAAIETPSNKFVIDLSLKLPPAVCGSTFQRHFKTVLTKNFIFNSSQISIITYTYRRDLENYVAVVTSFRLTLTPYQVFILDNRPSFANMNISRKSKQFLKLFNITRKFVLHFKNYRYPVILLNSKQLSCFVNKVLDSSEYRLDNKTGDVFENKTGRYFSSKHYYIIKKGKQNITLCRRFVLSQCAQGAEYEALRREEYVILPNLSLYFNRTNRTYDFGDYQISEDLNRDINESFPNGSDTERLNEERFENRIFPKRAKFAICVRYVVIETQHKLRSDHVLAILTSIGFTMSIICLSLLLITYGMFRELRTIPGMNTMNLCFSLLLSHCVWFICSNLYSKTVTTLCTVSSILEHYLILVSFVAMSVISFHSCLVFSQSFAIAKTTKRKARRTILKFSAVVWCCPAIFVAICVILDKTGAFIINYGVKCWLGTATANLYLFLLPVALSLLFNVSALTRTAVSLFRHQTQMVLLQKKRRQNLVICAKLSTMVGFPWIFAFFGAYFPEVISFGYLFVVFVSLQGVYIGVVFMCNVKTLRLFKKRWSRNERV